MIVTPTRLPEVLMIEPAVHADARGFFMETWSAPAFREATGLDVAFVQDNQSHSRRHVLRGIHYQVRRPQGKLVRAIAGAVFDVVVDLRRASPRFGRWVGVELSDANRRQLWVPPGFGHGFLVLSDSADVVYKATETWLPEGQRTLRWSDPVLGIDWPLAGAEPVLSAADRSAPLLAQAEVFE
jgi:dTDP-4-dehydrorhamnose 3,5-epimerase